VRWTLVADRGFASAALFARLRQGGPDWSVRLRLRAWVTVAGGYAMLVAQLDAGRLVVGQRTAASIGRGPPAPPLVPAWVVVHAAVATPPKHEQAPGTARERARRAKARAQRRQHKQGRTTTPPGAAAQKYAQTWGLVTTAPTVEQAVAGYPSRMPIAAPFRDGHHHGAVRAAVVDLPREAMVGRRFGVVGLAHTLQLQLGQRLSAALVGQQRRAQWAVSDRVRWLWCGQRLFDDPGYDWRGWLAQQWASLGPPVGATPATPRPEPAWAEAA
jgi:hypothetical protein